ncbi:centromere protein V [Staphylotrichum tortipilum]|uniref:Centromere protein V n=1 Tax=Staphylotrichum tortipilum TaxID=2831512 RepID=A0AAN6MFB2_9PEZI|nr:centromere protein V [Staphylotrichum longicolle]
MSQKEEKPDSTAQRKEEEQQTSGTYEAGCHCGYIKFSVTLTPALPETKVMNCNCSACTRFGYLLVYPEASSVTWHNDSRARCSTYRFNTKKKDQLFCKHCGASLGIDFREVFAPKHLYGISVRSFFNVDLDSLTYRKGDGRTKALPAGDLSGQYWDEEKHELK